MHNAWLSWSSGKDSAYTLKYLQSSQDYKVTGLVTTITETFERVSMHAIRLKLLQWQADNLNLPMHLIKLPYPCTSKIYEQKMHALIKNAAENDVTHMAFGDLFLEDIRRYREEKLLGSSIIPLFPLWGLNTKTLARNIIDSGFKAKITCVDPKQLSANFAGREFDHAFLDELPTTVDPCGENGEFHSFVYDAPIFSTALEVKLGEIVSRDGFIFADLKA